MSDAKTLAVPPTMPVITTSAPSTSPLMVNKPTTLPVRARAPRRFSPGLVAVAPVGSTFQGLGAPLVEGPQSVAETVRARKDGYVMADGVPVTGQYVSATKAMAAGGSAISQRTMPRQGYAGASYNYADPNKSRIGSTLQGAPGFVPKMVKQSKYYIPLSVAEERRRQVATLMGLGAIDYSGIDYTRISTGAWTPVGRVGADKEDGVECTNEQTCREVKVIRVRKALAAAGKPVTDDAIMFYGASKWNSISTLTGVIQQTWNDRFLQNKRLNDDNYASGFAKWASDFLTAKGDDVAKAALDKGGELLAPPPPPPVNPPVNMTQTPPVLKVTPFMPGLLNPQQKNIVNRGIIPSLDNAARRRLPVDRGMLPGGRGGPMLPGGGPMLPGGGPALPPSPPFAPPAASADDKGGFPVGIAAAVGVVAIVAVLALRKKSA